jgi:hypothetical protein
MHDRKPIENLKQAERKFTDTPKNFYIGEVIDNTDEFDSMRIKVKIAGLDDNNARVEDLPYCFPLLPKQINILPKIGESVRIVPEDPLKPFDNRGYWGPIISQPHRIKKELDKTTAKTGMNGKRGSFDTAPSKNVDSKDLFPSPNKTDEFYKEDIGIVGRDNVDIILKDNELILRAGKHQVNNVLKKNVNNPALMKMKFKEDGTISSINFMADFFNFMATSGTPKMNNSLTQKVAETFIEQGHPVPFGDFTRDLLIIMVQFMISHTHNGDNKPATSNELQKKLANFDINSILSKFFRIN